MAPVNSRLRMQVYRTMHPLALDQRRGVFRGACCCSPSPASRSITPPPIGLDAAGHDARRATARSAARELAGAQVAGGCRAGGHRRLDRTRIRHRRPRRPRLEWSDEELYLSAPGPGRDAWVSIDRATGAARFESTDRGWIAYFNDLHKGRNTGLAWTIFIDVVAAACLFFR